MKQILFATENEAKIKRFSKKLEEKGIEIISLKDIPLKLEIEENGRDAIENALIKARAYYHACGITTIAMDDNLFLENVSEEYQPGMYVRRRNGKRLSDEEMIEYYIDLVKNFGENGKLSAKWVYGMALIHDDEESTYSWNKESFYLVDKQSNKIETGYPLNTISVHKKLGKYFTDLTDKDKLVMQEDESDVIDFITSHV